MISRDLCSWEDWTDWRRRHHHRLRRVSVFEARSATTGLPVLVIMPTLWGRLLTCLREWRDR